MKITVVSLLLFVGVSSAWAAKKINVQELTELLHSMAQEKKSDAEIATVLKQLELGEELTRAGLNTLVGLVNGPLSTEQVYILEARSANLAPPAADLPAMPSPDEATRKAILAKAEVYVFRTYDQLPTLSATRTTLRFQDNVEALAASSGLGSGAKEAVTSSGFSNPSSYMHYINSTATVVTSEHGVEKKPTEKEIVKWGANGMVGIQEPTPSLGEVFKEAQAADIHWLRWELIDGKQIAVFSYSVPKPKSKLAVNVCCFPNLNQAGIARFYSSSTAAAIGGPGANPAGGVAGNFQTHTEWHEYKSTAGYHGRLFIEPETGVVVRLIVEAEFKPSEVVHQLDTRVDYGSVRAGANTFVAPVKTVIDSVVVPNGESGAGGYSTRCTLLTSEYSEYRMGVAQ